MTAVNPIPIVDLFAGPGGLGEGFSSLDGAFNILVSAEMDTAAHKTLHLRAYYRALRHHFPDGLEDYYRFCNGESPLPWSGRTQELWELAGLEARQLTLGKPEDNFVLDAVIESSLDRSRPWVLIGGPPCQAYSLAGRVRNMGKSGYKAEEDHRHFLYREYLRIIQQYRPSIFVMENVTGILSARVSGKHIFNDILQDLADPDAALGVSAEGEKYRICSLGTGDIYRHGDNPEAFDATKFIVRAEEYGIPQARHRVILLGIKESFFNGTDRLHPEIPVAVKTVIGELPSLRSTLTREADSPLSWMNAVAGHLDGLLGALAESPESMEKLVLSLTKAKQNLVGNLDSGALRYTKTTAGNIDSGPLDRWYLDDRLKVWLNHEARGHMTEDLRRYVYAASFADAYGYSPRGPDQFTLPGLKPAHQNWDSGKFADRFRVQTANGPSTTITSHISKDGHYFIHHDPVQCRSLTVREAARLQTFPDNYFFQGNRTQQFHQVGNAVPPLLASKIARVVKAIMTT